MSLCAPPESRLPFWRMGCLACAAIGLGLSACLPNATPDQKQVPSRNQAAQARPKANADMLRLVTWNVEWFFDHDESDQQSELAKRMAAPSEQAWRWKLTRVAAVLAELQPTIVCLQEVEDRDVIYQLTRELKKTHQQKYRYAFIEGYDFGTEQNVAILYREGLVEFSRREQTKEMFESEQYYSLSKHIFARFEWERDGKQETLWVLNVHLRAKAEHADLRRRQAALIREWIQPALSRGENVVVTGDFNSEEDYGQESTTSEIAILRSLSTSDPWQQLHDAHQAISPQARATHFTGRQYDRVFYSGPLANDDAMKTDLVFSQAQVRRDLVIQNEVDRDHWQNYWTIADNERDFSDHYPVVVDFVFQ